MSLKFKMRMSGINAINNDIEKRLLHTILWSFGALAILYIFLLGNMVMNIVERRSLEGNAVALSNEVHDLELAYLSLSGNIDLAFSHSLGFKETKATFATRKSLGSAKIVKNEI